MQEKIYVRAVLLFILILILAVIITWYPIIFEKNESVIPVSNNDVNACVNGQMQSPINIETENVQAEKKDTFQLVSNPVQLTSQGKVISGESIIKVNDEKYKLDNIHFHIPSEHTINGKVSEMEMHLVHKNEQGDKLVVAILFEAGDDNELLSQIILNSRESIELEDFIQLKRAYYYTGSLTKPPCTEGVKWIVVKEPFQLSKDQLEAYQQTLSQNSRPTQKLNKRVVREIVIQETIK